MVWTDLSDRSFEVTARVNHTLTAVPPRACGVGDASAGDGQPAAMPTEGKVFLFGGDNGAEPLADLWEYDLATGKWSEPRVGGIPPSARSRHTATHVGHYRTALQLTDDRIYVFGGVGLRTETLLYLDVGTMSWITPKVIGEQVGTARALLGHRLDTVRHR